MASATSVGTSPLSFYEFPHATDSNSDPDEALWTIINSSGSNPGSVALHSSPGSHTLGSPWAVLEHAGQHFEHEPSPGAALPSPLNVDFEQHSPFSGASYGDASGSASFGAASSTGDVNFPTQNLAQDGQGSLAPGDLLFDEQFNADFNAFVNSFVSGNTSDQQQLTQFQALGSPWEPINLQNDSSNNANANANSNSNAPAPAPGETSIFVMEDPSFIATPSPQQYSPSIDSISVSPPASASPSCSPAVEIKTEFGMPSENKSRATAPIPVAGVRKVNSTNRVQKRKAAMSTSPNLSGASFGSSNSSKGGSSATKFVVVTPSSISLHGDKANPFECMDAAARPSQRGRKGPLPTDTKQSALQVRRMGACFSCHARKVRCDKERPCRSCVRLAQQIPQVVCWQFSDFTAVLFPDFIRSHLRRDEVARFVADNIQSFSVDGMEKPCVVELFSGIGFSAVLQVRAKFFTAKTAEVLQQWHVQMRPNAMDLQARGAAPIGLEMEASGGGGGDSQKNELKRRVREYIQAMVDEPRYAELVTQSQRHTRLPRELLRIVHDYANRCDVPMVRRALSIYAMHYVMAQHLCLTQRNIADLQPTGLVPQSVPYVTPRVLNRQVKAVIDDMLAREMQLLFDNFSKSLKPKLRREWAPCLASFLVLCLFMEAVEMAADTYVMTDNEISLRQHYTPKWKRSFVLGVNAEIENMPFRQFAFQFHQIYQTHSRDASTRGFNPLVDDACFELGELDRDAADMVHKLRRFINEDWSELDYLTADPILPNTEDHPYPRDVGFNYTGRLVAKFLLSFTDERYILDSKV